MKINTTQKILMSSTLVVALVVSPVFVSASSNFDVTDYNSLTLSEKISYLYGRIAMIQEIIDAREGMYKSDNDYMVRPVSSSEKISVNTLSAMDVSEDEADLRGRINLEEERSVRVWFEYGEGRVMDSQTVKKKIYSSSRSFETFSVNIDELESGERYYYRAVAEDNDGGFVYGATKSFTTDDVADDFKMSLSDTSIDQGDRVYIDWKIPEGEEGSQNWIGLYERGDSNKKYISYNYLSNNNEGSLSFRVYEEGSYEFRLFLDNSYNDELTSKRLRVD